MIKHLLKIMDFKEPTTQFMEECKKKLASTYMIVDNKIEYIKYFDFVEKRINTGENYIAPTSLEQWLPEAGLYITEDGVAYCVQKRPKRQWFKSWHPDYYSLEALSADPFNNSGIELYNKIHKSIKQLIGVDKDQYIYYFNQTIGIIQNKTIVCTDGLYEQELIDWNNNAN
jgi:hypothetical protein